MGGLRRVHAVHLRADADRDAGHRRHPAVLRASSPRTRSWPRPSPAARARRSTTCSTRMGVLAALLTAFYMARLMAMTFLGENRTGEQERGAPARGALDHDRAARGARRAEPGRRRAQPARTLVGGHAALERWLEPVIAPARGSFGWSMPARARPSTSSSAPRWLSASLGPAGSASAPRWRRPIPTGAEAPADTRLRAGAQPQVLRGRALRRARRPAARLALAGGALEGRGPGRWWTARR